MTKEQEEKIIRQAKDILERRMTVVNDVQIDLRKVLYYGAYYQGARVVAEKLIPLPQPQAQQIVY